MAPEAKTYSTEPVSGLTETFESLDQSNRGYYQRKVTFTLTRHEAELIKALALAGSVNQSLAAQVADHVGHGWTAGRVKRAVKNAWKKMDSAVIKRDEGQRLKENGQAATQPAESDDDFITLF